MTRRSSRIDEWFEAEVDPAGGSSTCALQDEKALLDALGL
jgi:hypothetical protein